MTIDWWTLGLQAINVAVLVWLLQRFFWRPVAAMIDRRRVTAQRILTEAETARGEATAALTMIEQTRAGFAKERETILIAAHAAAEQARAAHLAKAAQEVAALEAAARASVEQATQAAEQAWVERSSLLAVDIAQRLAARLTGAAVYAAFLDWLLKEIAALPDAARQAVAANGTELEAVSATQLDPAEQERYRGLIGKAFAGHPRIVFKVDPALIAGLELRGPHFVIGNSWRADLNQILAGLTHDDRH